MSTKNLATSPRLALYPETHQLLKEKCEASGDKVQTVGNKLLLRALKKQRRAK